MRESEIESYLVKKVKEVGGECRKVKWLGRNGAPDRLVMLPPRDREENGTIWVELKAEGLAALFPHTPHERQQHREHERMRAMGQRVVVLDTFAAIDELLA
jgi:hypothetical protein